MQTMKSLLSTLLALVLVFTMLPVQAFAAEEAPDATVDSGNVTVEGTNSFGTLLSEAIAEEQDNAAAEEQEYEAGYTLTDLVIEGSTATVTYDSMEEALVVVALYSEDGLQMLTSATTMVDPEETIASVTFEGEMPEYFLASAYLVDTYDLSPLCPAYDTPMYTREMQELLASTVDDYDSDKVLNLDEDETTNFAVYAETTKIIDYVAGVNSVVSVDDETATYIIENADEQITTLAVGDVFAYTYGENEILIAKVASVSVDGTTVTIIGDELEIEDAFAAVKIDGTGDTSNVQVDDSTAHEGVSFVGTAEDAGTYSTRDSNSSSYKTGLKYECEAAKIGNDNNAVEFTAAFSVSVSIKFEYYITNTYQRIELRLNSGLEGSVSVTGKVSDSIKLGSLLFPILHIVDVGFEPELVVTFEGSVTVSFGYTTMVGIVVEHGEQGWDYRQLYSQDDLHFASEFSGKVFIGLSMSPVVKVAKGFIAELKIKCTFGVEASLSQEFTGEVSSSKKHECLWCSDGDISFKLSLTPSVKFLKSDKLSLSVTALNLSYKICDIYWSIDHDEFGFGNCPYILYKITATVVDRDGTVIPNVAVFAGVESAVTNKNGVAEFYLPTAEYVLETTVGQETAKYTIYADQAQKITLRLGEDYDGILGVLGKDEAADTSAILASGSCGENVTWTLYVTGRLCISGEGAIEYSYPYYPWEDYLDLIKELDISEGITSIASDAFAGCSNLVTISLPQSLQAIYRWAFSGCDKIESVYIPNLESWCNTFFDAGYANPLSKGADLFIDGTKATDIILPEGITEIGQHTFGGCTSITSVSIPNSVITIGSTAFGNCCNLEKIEIPNSVTNIDGYAFSGTNLSDVVIPEGVSVIEDGTFSECTNLISVDIPDSVTSIKQHAFDGCTKLTDISLPHGITVIANNVFSNCKQLTSITIPENVTSIENSAFWGTGLKSIVIPRNVTSIARIVFARCYNLSEIIFCGDPPRMYGEYTNGTFLGVRTTAYYPADNENWTSSVLGNYGGTITWVPYMLDENGDMVINEAAELTEIDMPEDAVVQTDLDVPALNFGEKEDVSNSDAVYPGDYDTEVTETYTLKTASFQGLVPGQQYVLLAMASLDAENPLAADNLLYIDQAEALENGTLVFRYVQRETTDISYVVACGASNKDLADAEISFPEMMATGSIQAVDPTVIYDGKTLTEGQDYVIVGTVSFTDPGEYTCYIRGVRNYTGLVECTYTVLENPLGIAVGVSGDTQWVLSKDGILTVYGSGAMGNYSDVSELPWYDYIDQITSVVIEEGVTTIGNQAFYAMPYLVSVTISDTVTSIGEYAFGSCTALAEITFAGDAPAFGENVFQKVVATVTYPGNNATWTEEVMQQYGGTITWVPTQTPNGWVSENGSWYYYVDNVKQTGWLKVNGYWYYMNADGVMQTGWQKINGYWYYMASGGAMQTGWVSVGGKWYYMASGGAMQTGWVSAGGKWYYMDSSGAMQTGWLKDGSYWYYLDSTGAMTTGWVKEGSNWFYMNKSGVMQTGWQKINGYWYYFASGGAMQTGWQQINGKWYYFASGGAMQTGWVKDGSYWYYMDASGAMVTGTQVINGKTYVFNKSGVWIG